jgi:uncharacterized membrane protein (DUF106 family)
MGRLINRFLKRFGEDILKFFEEAWRFLINLIEEVLEWFLGIEWYTQVFLLLILLSALTVIIYCTVRRIRISRKRRYLRKKRLERLKKRRDERRKKRAEAKSSA